MNTIRGIYMAIGAGRVLNTNTVHFLGSYFLTPRERCYFVRCEVHYAKGVGRSLGYSPSRRFTQWRNEAQTSCFRFERKHCDWIKNKINNFAGFIRLDGLKATFIRHGVRN